MKITQLVTSAGFVFAALIAGKCDAQVSSPQGFDADQIITEDQLKLGFSDNIDHVSDERSFSNTPDAIRSHTALVEHSSAITEAQLKLGIDGGLTSTIPRGNPPSQKWTMLSGSSFELNLHCCKSGVYSVVLPNQE